MTRTIEVCLGEAQHLVGILRYNREGARESASFEYDPAWGRARIPRTSPSAAGTHRKIERSKDSIPHTRKPRMFA